MTARVQVELLTVPDCPGGGPTELLLHELAAQLRIELQLRRTVISTQQQADKIRLCVEVAGERVLPEQLGVALVSDNQLALVLVGNEVRLAVDAGLEAEGGGGQ